VRAFPFLYPEKTCDILNRFFLFILDIQLICMIHYFRVSEITKPDVKSVEPNNDIIHEAGSGDNAGAKTKRKGQRLKIVEIENGDDITGNNGIEPALGPGNHQNNENGQPLENGLSDQVGKSSSETSKGILEDNQVINSVKHEQEGMPTDNMVNSETLVSK
jgi:hypothetical protein